MSGAPHLARLSCGALLLVITAGAGLAPVIAPAPYDRQFRECPDAPPSQRFLLGTDELGRDRFSRLLYGCRTSLFLALAAATVAVGVAAGAGILSGLAPRYLEPVVAGTTDLALSLPWLFLLLAVRAILPLNTPPAASVAITFALLGCLGWPGPARVIRAGAREILASEYVRAARARGAGRARVLLRHGLPNLAPILSAQFLTAVPVFILAEANLGLLGLGVMEPLPSWGSLLHEMGRQSLHLEDWLSQPWLLAPILTLLAAALCLQVLFRGEIVQ
jgi:ABC-type dipeptide/oligopeptide/nickel transport system permease subunit